MRALLRCALIGLFALVVGAGSACAAPQGSAPVEIVSAEFGVFDASNPREMLFAATRVVPHKEGQRYGWIIELRTTLRSVSVREEYLLGGPAAAAPAPDPLREVLEQSQQRRNQVSQRQLVPVDGRIYGEWAIGANEPAGRRHLQVLVEDEVAARFEYEVR